MPKRLLITGGAGFIGSALVRMAIAQGHEVVNLDKLTYAADLRSLETIASSPSYHFEKADIVDLAHMRSIFYAHKPDLVFHLAAESHVDRSIDNPLNFISTNITGTGNLLHVANEYWHKELNRDSAFRFMQVSTDEVYGSLGTQGRFTETSPYQPNSPYAASKAGGDHLALAWHNTYKLPVVVTNCSNNYGPYQHPEKLIPTIIRNALTGSTIPIYGTGSNVRDWLYVDDHVTGLLTAAIAARVGETYNFGGDAEVTNLGIAHSICTILDKEQPLKNAGSYVDQIGFVQDRPGHDFRYAVDSSKVQRELGWMPTKSLNASLADTVRWYLNNRHWWDTNEKASGRLGIEQ